VAARDARRDSSRLRRASLAWLVGAAWQLGATGGCTSGDARPRQPEVPYAEARALVDRHCVPCHSERPTVPAFPIAPNGLELDTAEQMHQNAEGIKQRTVVDKTMPLLNKTGMTDPEREILRRWIDAGAKTAQGARTP
jgi:uncharacterized membrane protein